MQIAEHEHHVDDERRRGDEGMPRESEREQQNTGYQNLARTEAIDEVTDAGRTGDTDQGGDDRGRG
jgi:hypothetical protein